MSEEIKMNDVMSAVNALRDSAEKGGVNSPEFKELEAKTESILEAQEKQSQEAAAKIAESEKKSEELQSQFNELQVEMARSASSKDVDYKETPEYKALNMLAKSGVPELDAETKGFLRSDSDTAGGYLTNVEMDSNIIKGIIEQSPVRSLARVRTVGRKTIEMPVRKSVPVATFEGEAAPASESESGYGTETLTCARLTAKSRFTYDMLIDSGFDIESEVMADITEAFATAEGAAFVNGDGNKKPEGFLSHADIVAGASTTEGSGAISGDDLIALTGELKVGYNPVFGFNRQTLAKLRTLKGSSNDHYLWQVGMGDVPNTILGEGYTVLQDMPSIAANALSVIYGDFMRGYTVIDRTGTAVIRDELSEADENIIKLVFHRYLTGQVVLPEAFKALKIKA